MKQSYTHRAAFGAWINDMRNQPLAGELWPSGRLDDELVADVESGLELQAQAGFNEFDVAGFFATWSWPVDIERSVDEPRGKRIGRIIDAAHARGIKVLCLLGVYSWGYDEIIAQHPEVGGTNPHALCGSKEKSWAWVKRIVDYIAGHYAIDGFHLESSDLGRCHCADCASQGNVEYYSRLNGRTAQYIRQHWPHMVLTANMCGRKLADVGRSSRDILEEVIATLYQPRGVAERRGLTDIFMNAENTYFGRHDSERIREAKFKAQEIELTPWAGREPGAPQYLNPPYLDDAGRKAYQQDLLAISAELSSLGHGFGSMDRIGRIASCLQNVILDLG